MRAVADEILTALQFLTRLPVPEPAWREGQLRRALAFFPVAGAAVGLLGAAVWLIAGEALPAGVSAGLALAAMLWVTGALHEDGLGDVADALGGRADRERALEIMRDSRIGSYALVAVVLSLGLRWSALAALEPWQGAVALLVAATAARGAMVAASAGASPARPDGLGAMLARGAEGRELGLALGLSLALSLLAAGAAGVLALVAALAVAAAVVRLMRRRVGGMTGDGYGAIASLGETAALIALAGAMGGAA